MEPSETYFRAHRAYMIVAGLLASWELLGVELSPRDGAMGWLKCT